jgi:hypothetical protein
LEVLHGTQRRGKETGRHPRGIRDRWRLAPVSVRRLGPRRIATALPGWATLFTQAPRELDENKVVVDYRRPPTGEDRR